jgi:hypothetical protein
VFLDDLTEARFKVGAGGIVVEGKEKVKGCQDRSPYCADAAALARSRQVKNLSSIS